MNQAHAAWNGPVHNTVPLVYGDHDVGLVREDERAEVAICYLRRPRINQRAHIKLGVVFSFGGALPDLHVHLVHLPPEAVHIPDVARGGAARTERLRVEQEGAERELVHPAQCFSAVRKMSIVWARLRTCVTHKWGLGGRV